MKNPFKKSICKFCGRKAEPIIVYGEKYYLTAECSCPEARELLRPRFEYLNSCVSYQVGHVWYTSQPNEAYYKWLASKPKTHEELQIEALNRIAVALEKGQAACPGPCCNEDLKDANLQWKNMAI